jgi:hypothetical protein
VVVFAFRVKPDFEDHGTEAALAPADRTKLLRIVALPVDDVNLIEYFRGLFEADAMLSFDLAVLPQIELEPNRRISLLYHPW